MSTNGLMVLEVPTRLSWDDWTSRVRNVATMKKKLYFYIGDLVLYGEATFGEKASQMLNEFGYTNEQLSNFRWVSKKFPPEERCDLPWSLHQAAAALPKRERDKAISAALAGEMNRQGIRTLVSEFKANGAQDGSKGPKNPLPTARDAAREALGLAMAGCASLFRREATDAEWSEALDALTDAAVALKAKLGA